MPPVITPGPALEKSLNLLSWSIEHEVLIIQCLPILVPVLIVVPETTKVPSSINTFELMIASLEMICWNLKLLFIFFISLTIFSLTKLNPTPIIPFKLFFFIYNFFNTP